MIEVTKDKFQSFISSYSVPLETSIHMIPEPPQRHYNDWSLGKWPDSVVAYVQFPYNPDTDTEKYFMEDNNDY